MNNERNMKTLVIAALVISVVAIGVGFAAFSTTLQINGTATVNTDGKSWNVYFSGIQKTEDSTSGVETVAPGIQNGTIGDNTSNTAISAFTAAFTAPGQKLSYEITVTNGGSYTAKLTSMDLASLDKITTSGTGDQAEKDAANVKSHLKYSFTKADGDAVALNDTIAAGATQKYVLTIEYEDFTDAAELPKAQVNISIPQSTMTFSQAE